MQALRGAPRGSLHLPILCSILSPHPAPRSYHPLVVALGTAPRGNPKPRPSSCRAPRPTESASARGPGAPSAGWLGRCGPLAGCQPPGVHPWSRGPYSSLRSSRCSRSRSLKQPSEAMLSRTSGSSSPFDGRLRMATRRPGAGSRQGSGSCFPPLGRGRNVTGYRASGIRALSTRGAGVRAPTCSSFGNPGVPAPSPCCACVLLPWDPEIRVPSSSSLSNLGIPPSSCFSRWGPLIFGPPPFLPQGARCSVVPYSQVPGVFLNLLQLCGGREAEMRSCEHSGPQGKLMGWLWGSVTVPSPLYQGQDDSLGLPLVVTGHHHL